MAAVASMLTSNAQAAVSARAAGAHAMTDVTGFGLVGHLHKMLHASGVSATLDAEALPILPGAQALIDAGVIPGGTQRNRDFVGHHVSDHALMALIADPQTSGGLLFACPPTAAMAAVRELVALGHPAQVIGRVTNGRPGHITING